MANRERGLKAAINNPRVSEQAKQRDREILATEFGEHFEEGGASMRARVESASPDVMSSGMEEQEDEEGDQPLESPPPKVKQTGLRSAATQPLPKMTTTAPSVSKMASSEMMDSPCATKPMRARSSSAGAVAKQGDVTEGKDTGNV